MTNPPKLSEMRHALGEPVDISPTLSEMQHSLSAIEPSSPTLSEMQAAIDGSESLAHFGIKGMKWGVRRSKKALASNRIKNADGEDVGGLSGTNKSAAARLKGMKSGDVIVVDSDGGPKVMVKQGDGSFRETALSADAQSVLRTVNKQPSEMSTRELKEATARAQAIEQYNKIFNPMADPNAALKARAEALDLQSKLAQAHAKMNPTRTQRVSSFVKDVSPIFTAYKQIDQGVGGGLSKLLKETMGDIFTAPTPTQKPTAPPKQQKTKKEKKQKQSGDTNASDVVYDVTVVGRSSDPMNPYIPAIERRS